VIFLERLIAHHVGEIDDVNLVFAPRGRHLVDATAGTAETLSAALRCALFGDVAPGFGRRDDALVGASIVAGGASYTIERRIARDGRLSTTLARGGPSGLVPVAGVERIERELDHLLGTDREAVAALIWPPRDLEPLSERLREIVRAWLGTRRMSVLSASVEVGQDLREAERLASLHVALANAADAHATAIAQVEHLDLTRKRQRAARAVQQLEEAERLMAEADGERRGMSTLAEGFEGHLQHAEQAIALAHLLDRREIALGRVSAVRARRTTNEERLAELDDLRSVLKTKEQRLSVLERGLAAYGRADAAALEAEKARASSTEVGKHIATLERARHELSASRSKAERLAAQATRAGTLSTRASEEAHLPTAHRLWREWLNHAPEPDEDAAQTETDALYDRLDELEMAVRAQDRNGQVRAGWRRLAAGGAVAGLAAGVVGLLAVPPLTPLGLTVGLAGGLAGAWLSLADRGTSESAANLAHELDVVADELQQAERRRLAAEQARTALNRVEHRLNQLDLEIPASAERAVVLRDSAAVRLRQMSDGDKRRDSAELIAAAATADQAAEDAAREVRRLEARVAALNRDDPEQQQISAATERRIQLEKAADARRSAERLATELEIGTSRETIEVARRESLREVQQIRQRLGGGADLELQRQVEIRDETRANDELAALDAEIARLRPPDMNGASERPRAVQLAHAAALISQLGSDRAHAAARAAAVRGRTVQAASRRHTTDLAAALRALGIDAGVDPTAAEARAAIPDLDADTVDADQIRRSLRQAREAARRTETRVQTLELRAGVAQSDIDAEDAQRRLDAAVHARRVREIGHRIVTEALDASLETLPAAIERELRLMLPAASAGRFWDARSREGLGLEVWDAAAGHWRVPADLQEPDRERVERALALAFATAGPPLDATDLPAFIWLEQSNSDHDGEILQAIVAATGLGAAAQRYPQVIATGRSVSGSLGWFDRVTRLGDGQSAGMSPSVGGMLEAR
jgi:hypothetical protein